MKLEELKKEYATLHENFETRRDRLLNLPKESSNHETLFEEVSSLYGQLLFAEKQCKIEQMKECSHVFITPIVTGDKAKDCHVACIKCGLNTKYHNWPRQYLNIVQREMFTIYCQTYKKGIVTFIYEDLEFMSKMYRDIACKHPEYEDRNVVGAIKQTLNGIQKTRS